MEIEFDGAARTVTGSQHLLTINGSKILLDCGLFQGKRQESFRRNRSLPFEAHKIDCVILSHAHIDHCGNLPSLVKDGFEGKIHATRATADLTRILLMDSAHIQEMDAEYLNKKLARHGEPLVEPLYTSADAGHVQQHLRGHDYDEIFEPAPGVQARLADAGHILGSAAVQLDIEEKGRKFRLWFSGDIGRRNLPIIRDPVLPEKVDYLLMESTYGDRLHRDPQLAYEEMKEVLKRTLRRGGKVIIPSFAVGRTQELVYFFRQMFDEGSVPRVPVYVDSPLAVNATDIFKEHPECFDEEAMSYFNHGSKQEVLGFHLLTYVRSVDESKALNGRKDPMIIISASGMAENGRILHHLANNIENPLNTVLIVSWQAPDTLGRRLAEREREVKIFGDVYRVKAEVATIGGLSAHAGQTGLVEYALATRDTLKRLFLVHGEPQAAAALQSKLEQAGLKNITYPDRGKSIPV